MAGSLCWTTLKLAPALLAKVIIYCVHGFKCWQWSIFGNALAYLFRVSLTKSKCLSTMALFICETACNSNMQLDGTVHWVGILGNMSQIGSFQFVSCHPRVPSQVAKLIGHVAVAHVLAKTSIPGWRNSNRNDPVRALLPKVAKANTLLSCHELLPQAVSQKELLCHVIQSCQVK